MLSLKQKKVIFWPKKYWCALYIWVCSNLHLTQISNLKIRENVCMVSPVIGCTCLKWLFSIFCLFNLYLVLEVSLRLDYALGYIHLNSAQNGQFENWKKCVHLPVIECPRSNCQSSISWSYHTFHIFQPPKNMSKLHESPL